MSPAIREKHGFIDKYIGDAIMALFPYESFYAVEASVLMHKTLTVLNEKLKQSTNGKLSINIGVGLHRGKLILGTVGEKQRMDSTVISDAVNVASRLQDLTKSLGVTILASQQVIESIQGRDFSYRFLGRLRIRGREEKMNIFEILDGESERSRDAKMESQEIMTQGIVAYRSRKLQEALNMFEQVLKKNPQDLAAVYYRTLCLKRQSIEQP